MKWLNAEQIRLKRFCHMLNWFWLSVQQTEPYVVKWFVKKKNLLNKWIFALLHLQHKASSDPQVCTTEAQCFKTQMLDGTLNVQCNGASQCSVTAAVTWSWWTSSAADEMSQVTFRKENTWARRRRVLWISTTRNPGQSRQLLMKASVTTLVASEEAYDLLSAVAGDQINIERYYGAWCLHCAILILLWLFCTRSVHSYITQYLHLRAQ